MTTSKNCEKSYQMRNDNGRCVNKPCKDGKIRDKITKNCRSKKTSRRVSVKASRKRSPMKLSRKGSSGASGASKKSSGASKKSSNVKYSFK